MNNSLHGADARRKPFPLHALRKLPFISINPAGQINSFWAQPAPESYRAACATGADHAHLFARVLRSAPAMVGAGLLCQIAADIDFEDHSASRGYWVGFFAQVEHLIHSRYPRRPSAAIRHDRRTEASVQLRRHGAK